jgi:single-stranded DNA-binding protein
VQRPHREDGEDRGADFIDVTVIGRRAETCATHLATGRKAAVEGGLLEPTNRYLGEHSLPEVT